MGYDIVRFQCPVDEELICTICEGVLEDPLQAPMCEHAFCASCIHEWLNHQSTCPVDRHNLTPLQLKPVPRIVKNLLSKLMISCDNAGFGCTSVVRLDMLQSHLTQCEFNPKRPVSCEQGCGSVVPLDELSQHNCVRELNSIVQNQNMKISELQAQIDDQRQQLIEQKRELQVLKDIVRTINTPLGNSVTSLSSQGSYDDDTQQWIMSLQRAHVTRWGGMISTPDAVLQAVIRRSLADSGCPPAILHDLMENTHERHWPLGLSSLETRQINRRRYEQYVCRRIPNKQAVIIMACENEHMGETMNLEPGIVMIFAHGIE